MKTLIYISLFLLLIAGKVLASTPQFAYVTNAASPGYISICKVNATTGQFEHCNNSYLNNLSGPLDIAFATIADNTYAYISNNNYPAFVTQCVVNDNNELQNCAATDVPSYTGITMHRSNQLYAYLSDNASVKKCAIMPDGQLNNLYCRDSGVGNLFSNGPIYIAFHTFNNVTYAYVANGDYKPNASVIQCRVQENGNFSNCVNAAIGNYFNGAADIDFAIIDGKTYAYVSQSGGAMTKCEVNLDNGLFNRCTITGSDFNTPIGMTVTKISDSLYAYVVDGGFGPPYTNTVSQCAINLSGDLNCVDSGVGNIFANPFGITIQETAVNF